MTKVQYIGLEEAQTVLAEIGIEATRRQLQRAAEKNGAGRRKLPFFVDPIDRTLKIEKNTLLNLYTNRQVEAERNCCSPTP